MKTLRRWILAATVTVTVLGCGASGDDPPAFAPLPDGAAAVTVTQEITSTVSGIEDRRRVTIRGEEEWLALWSEFSANAVPAPEPPAVDFEAEMVIAATMGARSTGGFEISIEGVFEADGRLIVQVLEQSPGSGCATTQVLTAPAALIIVPVTDAAVEFDDIALVNECR